MESLPLGRQPNPNPIASSSAATSLSGQIRHTVQVHQVFTMALRYTNHYKMHEYVDNCNMCFSSTDAPTITESKSNESATGRQVSLRCAASAVPTPDFEWFRDDTR